MDINELPKEPLEAIKVIIASQLALCRGTGTIGSIKSSNHPTYVKLLTGSLAGKKSASHLRDAEVAAAIAESSILSDEIDLPRMRQTLERALDLVIAVELDNHFIGAGLIEEFDEVKLGPVNT